MAGSAVSTRRPRLAALALATACTLTAIGGVVRAYWSSSVDAEITFALAEPPIPSVGTLTCQNGLLAVTIGWASLDPPPDKYEVLIRSTGNWIVLRELGGSATSTVITASDVASALVDLLNTAELTVVSWYGDRRSDVAYIRGINIVLGIGGIVAVMTCGGGSTAGSSVQLVEIMDEARRALPPATAQSEPERPTSTIDVPATATAPPFAPPATSVAVLAPGPVSTTLGSPTSSPPPPLGTPASSDGESPATGERPTPLPTSSQPETTLAE